MTCSLLSAPARIQIEWHCRFSHICNLPQQFSPSYFERFSSSSWVRSWDPTNVFSFFVLKNTVLLHTLAIAAARNLRRALKLCSRVTISASIGSCFAESPMTHGCWRSWLKKVFS